MLKTHIIQPGEWYYVNPEHQKLWNAMEKVEAALRKKGKEDESPTVRAFYENKPLDYYWSERFKGWMDWPRKRALVKKKITYDV